MYRKKNNLNHDQRKALTELRSMIRNNEIVICRANKDGKIVIITHDDYKAVMNTQLEKFEEVSIQAKNLQAYFNEIRPDCKKMLINLFENGCISKDLREMIYNNQDELEKMRQEKEEILEETKKATLSRELYSKRFNYLIHGIPESTGNAWETRQQIERLFRKFVVEGLQIEDPSSIKLADIHRLPQHPVYDSKI